MRIIRFLDQDGNESFGIQHADQTVSVAVGDLCGELSDTGVKANVSKVLSPIVPKTILCIGLNYAEHAKEGGRDLPERPVLFMKTPSATNHPGDEIVLPRCLRSERVDYEAELAVVIGKPCKNVSRNEALDYVLGYTCGNDVSARDWQRNGGGGQWCRGKTFDTFAPLGPILVTADEIDDPNDLNIGTTLNGQTMQSANTSDMIFDVATLIEFLSSSTTLEPGTVIFTGTPQGVGFARTPPVYLKAGDEVTVEIEKIGKLTNPVNEEKAKTIDQWELPRSSKAGF